MANYVFFLKIRGYNPLHGYRFSGEDHATQWMAQPLIRKSGDYRLVAAIDVGDPVLCKCGRILRDPKCSFCSSPKYWRSKE